VVRTLAGGALRQTDVAALAGRGRLEPVRAALLSALGIPVWWRGEAPITLPALGAPVITETDAIM
jgi:hypothetical protein